LSSVRKPPKRKAVRCGLAHAEARMVGSRIKRGITVAAD
jgi:hypothetical protein